MVSKRASGGFTLVELMVVVALASGLLLAAVTMVTTQLSHFSYQTAINHMHDNARLALRFLREDIARAGFAGCVSLQSGRVAASDVWSAAVLGQDAFRNSVRADGSTGQSDKLLLHFAEPLGLSVEPMSSSDSPVRLQGSNNYLKAADIDAGDMLLISDCELAVLIAVNSVAGDNTVRYARTDAPTQLLPKAFGTSDAGLAEVHRQQRVRYFLQKPSRAGASLALFTERGPIGNSQRFELIEGIDDLQFEYAVVTAPSRGCDFDSLSYIDAASVDPEQGEGTAVHNAALARLKNTVGVRVSIVARSTAATGALAKLISSPADAVIRKSFQTVVWLRNSCGLDEAGNV